MNKLTIMLVIAYHMNGNLALEEVQLALDEDYSPLFSYFQTSLMITGQWST
jgi:hypothetical protein